MAAERPLRRCLGVLGSRAPRSCATPHRPKKRIGLSCLGVWPGQGYSQISTSRVQSGVSSLDLVRRYAPNMSPLRLRGTVWQKLHGGPPCRFATQGSSSHDKPLKSSLHASAHANSCALPRLRRHPEQLADVLCHHLILVRLQLPGCWALRPTSTGICSDRSWEGFEVASFLLVVS
jgi:hypothetical protein